MRRLLSAPILRVMALLVLLTALVTPAIAVSRPPAAAHQALEPGGPFCCGGGNGTQQG